MNSRLSDTDQPFPVHFPDLLKRDAFRGRSKIEILIGTLFPNNGVYRDSLGGERRDLPSKVFPVNISGIHIVDQKGF